MELDLNLDVPNISVASIMPKRLSIVLICNLKLYIHSSISFVYKCLKVYCLVVVFFCNNRYQV